MAPSSEASFDNTLDPPELSIEIPRASSASNLIRPNRDANEKNPSCRRRSLSVVRFSVVEVREFDRVLGDHPSTKAGLSLELGWGYSERTAVSLDDYEEGGMRYHRSKNELKLTPKMRRKVMNKGFGLSKDEIEKAEKKLAQSRRRKERRSKMHPIIIKAEDTFLTATRRLTRTFNRRASVHSSG